MRRDRWFPRRGPRELILLPRRCYRCDTFRRRRRRRRRCRRRRLLPILSVQFRSGPFALLIKLMANLEQTRKTCHFSFILSFFHSLFLSLFSSMYSFCFCFADSEFGRWRTEDNRADKIKYILISHTHTHLYRHIHIVIQRRGKREIC